MTIREALLSMGYREEKPGVWLKPIGFQLFVFKESSNRWYNYFSDIKGEICLWESHAVDPSIKDYLFQVKDWETWTKTDLYVNAKSQFHLSTLDLNL